MGWSGLTLVTDSDLGQLEPETTDPRVPLGRAVWYDQRAEAKRDLKIWLELDFPDVPGVADRVVDAWKADYVFGYTGGAYTDLTVAAGDDTPGDVAVTDIFTTPSSDRIYIGAAWEFEAVALSLLGAKNAAASVLSVQYAGPAGWTTLPCVDGTAVGGVSLAQSGRVAWTIPTRWQRQRLNGTGDEYYWVALVVSGALTAGVTASQILAVRAPDALKRCAAYLALYHIYNGLAPGAANPESWQTKADKYLDQAKTLYGALKTHGSLWLDLNRDSAIEETSGEATIRAPFVLHRG